MDLTQEMITRLYYKCIDCTHYEETGCKYRQHTGDDFIRNCLTTKCPSYDTKMGEWAACLSCIYHRFISRIITESIIRNRVVNTQNSKFMKIHCELKDIIIVISQMFDTPHRAVLFKDWKYPRRAARRLIRKCADFTNQIRKYANSMWLDKNEYCEQMWISQVQLKNGYVVIL